MNAGRLGEIQGHATGLERDEEAFDIDVVHEMVDGRSTLRRGHAAVEHDCRDAGPGGDATQSAAASW